MSTAWSSIENLFWCCSNYSKPSSEDTDNLYEEIYEDNDSQVPKAKIKNHEDNIRIRYKVFHKAEDYLTPNKISSEPNKYFSSISCKTLSNAPGNQSHRHSQTDQPKNSHLGFQQENSINVGEDFNRKAFVDKKFFANVVYSTLDFGTQLTKHPLKVEEGQAKRPVKATAVQTTRSDTYRPADTHTFNKHPPSNVVQPRAGAISLTQQQKQKPSYRSRCNPVSTGISAIPEVSGIYSKDAVKHQL